MKYGRGFDSFRWTAEKSDWARFEDGVKKQLRFLEKVDDILVFGKHFIRLGERRTAINCFRTYESDKCLLCSLASYGWNAPVSLPYINVITKVIDRNDGRAKYIEGFDTLMRSIQLFQDESGDITSMDASVLKPAKAMSYWKILPVPDTTTPLTKEEIEKGNLLSTEKVMFLSEKTPEEALEIIKPLFPGLELEL